jgi:hypothetical protein
MEKRSVEFLATFPHKAGAVDFHGEEGVRITLDISEQYKADTLELPAFYFNKILRVRITVEE